MATQFDIPPEVVAKVHSGALPPSAYSPFLTPLHDRHVIGVNNAYLLGTWLDVCFFGDCTWYLVHRQALARWPNLKITCCDRFANRRTPQEMEGIKYLAKGGGHGIAKSDTKLYGIATDPRKVAWNGNSGAAAISLAAHFGVKRVVLLGFDMTHAGTDTHWHRGHGGKPLKSYDRFLRGFPAIAEDAARRGIEILNASPQSAIRAFPKISVKEVL